MVCAFAGSSNQTFFSQCNNKNKLYNCLINKLIMKTVDLCEQGIREYYCSTASGADMLCSEIVASLKNNYPDIKLHAIVPFHLRPDNWDTQYEKRYKDLLKQCDSSICLNEACQSEYYSNRNSYMIDNTDIIIAVYDSKNTADRTESDTLSHHAKEKGKEVIFIPFTTAQ